MPSLSQREAVTGESQWGHGSLPPSGSPRERVRKFQARRTTVWMECRSQQSLRPGPPRPFVGRESFAVWLPPFSRPNTAPAAQRVGFRAGPGEAQAAPAGPEPVAQVRAPEFEPSLLSAAAPTPRVRSGTSLLAPSSRPRPQWATHPAALRPQSPEWLPEPAEPPGSSDPPRALRGCPVASLRTSLRFVRFPESFS